MFSEGLPQTWRGAKLILIPKDGKYLAYPEAYRPISLLNTDYKILTSILDDRLNVHRRLNYGGSNRFH